MKSGLAEPPRTDEKDERIPRFEFGEIRRLVNVIPPLVADSLEIRNAVGYLQISSPCHDQYYSKLMSALPYLNTAIPNGNCKSTKRFLRKRQKSFSGTWSKSPRRENQANSVTSRTASKATTTAISHLIIRSRPDIRCSTMAAASASDAPRTCAPADDAFTPR